MDNYQKKSLNEKINQYKKKNVLLCGYSGGIAKAILYHLAPQVEQIVTASRSDVISDFPNHLHIKADLTNEKDVLKVFKVLKDKFDKLDIVINTIGGSLSTHSIKEFPINEFDRIISVNLRSAFLITQNAIKMMESKNNFDNNKKKFNISDISSNSDDSAISANSGTSNSSKDFGGNILHFVSSSAKCFSKNKAPYGIAKAGLARLIQYAAFECADLNIRVNGISPTYVFTERHEKELENKAKNNKKSIKSLKEEAVKTQLIHKPLYPKELLPIVDLLATTQVITGQIYNVTLGEIINY